MKYVRTAGFLIDLRRLPADFALARLSHQLVVLFLGTGES